MNLFALWLLWLNKLFSMMEGLQPPREPPTNRVDDEPGPKEPPPARPPIAPARNEPASPSTEIGSIQMEIARRLQELAPESKETSSARQKARPEPKETGPAPQETAQQTRAPQLLELAPTKEGPPPVQEPAPTEEESPPVQKQEPAPTQQEEPPPPQGQQDKAPTQQAPAAAQEMPLGQQKASAKGGTGEGSMTWRKRPMIYEIPTWVWLGELRARHGADLTLGTVPAAEWDAIAELAIDAVWLMGVWERSPRGIAVANDNADQQAEFRRLLPDYTLADNVGSAYCVRDYVAASHLGGPQALELARAALNARGLKLILDFVPNHVAIDHPWASHHPEYFVRGGFDDLARAPNAFVDVNSHVLANGRDPYFPPWRDVLQVNAFHTQLRAAAIETVSSIAAQCDGMRCDMAMLLLNEIFEHTWGHLAGERPATEYWQEVIPAVKARHPGTLFIAEVYWDLEYEMMQKGFDYCYDKRLYDRLVGDNAESIRAHLAAGLDYQERLVRFIENHDEPRAAATFHGAKERAAAIVIATTPGAKLIYDGQIEGRQVRLPVFLARRRAEAPDNELALFYRALLGVVYADLFHDGEWHLCERSGWPDNASFHDIVAWTWRYRDQRTLVVVNLSGHRAQAMVHLPWDDLRGQTWRLVETLAWECYTRDGDDLANAGLFVDLDAWGYHFLKFE